MGDKLQRVNVKFNFQDILNERKRIMIKRQIMETKQIFDAMSSSRPQNKEFLCLEMGTKQLMQAQKRIDVIYLCLEHRWSMRKVSRFLDIHFTSIRNIMKNYRDNSEQILTINQDPLNLTALQRDFEKFGIMYMRQTHQHGPYPNFSQKDKFTAKQIVPADNT